VASRVWPLFLIFSLRLPIGLKANEAKPVADQQAKHVRVFLEGGTSDIPKFNKLAQEKAPGRNLSFELTRDKESDWDVASFSALKEAACGATLTETYL